MALLVRALACGEKRSPDRNLHRAKNIMLQLTGYACCALGQGTLISFAPLDPGELNGNRPRLGKRLVVQWTSDPLTAMYNNLAYHYEKEMGTSGCTEKCHHPIYIFLSIEVDYKACSLT